MKKRQIRFLHILILVMLLSSAFFGTENVCAEITKKPAATQIESIRSSDSNKMEYVKISTPKNKKYTIYVSGKVNKNVKRLCIRIKRHSNKLNYIIVFVKPNSKGEFSIKINTKRGNKKVPVVLNKKGIVTKAKYSKATTPGYKAVKKMPPDIYHLYITSATTIKDANVADRKWYEGSLGGGDGYVYKEGLLSVKKGQNNNLKLVKYAEVEKNNITIRNKYEKKSYNVDSYDGSYVRYMDPYMKDFNYVLYNPETDKYDQLTSAQVKYIDTIARKITINADTQYQKVLKIYEYAAKNLYYDQLALREHRNQYANPYKNLYKINQKIKSRNSVNGKVATTCQGYAAMVVALARAEGIPARFVGGRHIHQMGTIWSDVPVHDLNRISHFWVEVYLDGEWIFVDSRPAGYNNWSRSSFNSYGKWTKKSVMNYAHFDSPDEQLSHSYIYTRIIPGSKEGKYINRKNEVEQITAFLDSESTSGVSNGSSMNIDYKNNEYDTWGNNSENNFRTDGYGQVSRISWPSENLAGKLDVSGFNKLATLRLNSNSITDINLSGCSELKYIYVLDNKLTEFDSTDSNADIINLSGNELTEANILHSGKEISVNSNEGGTFSLLYNKSKTNMLTIYASNAMEGYEYSGIYNGNGDCLSKKKNYSFSPAGSTYYVKYSKITQDE